VNLITELTFTAPVHLISEANSREHWSARGQRKVRQQLDTHLAFLAALKRRRVQLPCIVTLTRIGARQLDPDNLANAFKAVQDVIAKTLGVDDGDASKVQWVYRQRANGKRDYSLEVEIQAKEVAA